jgi:peptidoglycan-associated lipoprotein
MTRTSNLNGQENKMHKQWLRNALAIGVFAVLVGCAGSSTQEPATEPLPPDETPAVAEPAPEPEPISRSVDEAGNPVNPNTGMPLGRTFYFDFDRAVLRPEALALLELHASFLRDNADRRVLIEGHTDERGTREYNLALGERRSDSVRTFLVSSGVNRAQIETVSYGEERPIDPGHTEAAWAKNRRAEIVYR